MQVVKGNNQARMLRQQHTISKYVTAHVAYANTSEVSGLTIDTNFAEVTFNRLPGTAGSNAHLLMVIANTAA